MIQRHALQGTARVAYESKNNLTLLPKDSGSLTIRQTPQAANSFSSVGGPVTNLLSWPNLLGNVSLPYCLSAEGRALLGTKFYQFIERYQHSACAIVYREDDSDSLIIGSGTLYSGSPYPVSRTRNYSGIPNSPGVFTARHVYEGADLHLLYVRFYRYTEIQNYNANILAVKYDYLDIPILQINNISEARGLDAGFLTLANVSHIENANSYFLPIDGFVNPRNGTTIPPSGACVVFHFANGLHQVSIGGVELPDIGSPLYTNISLQAVHGASGAGTIWIGLERKACIYGISTYRIIQNGAVERRIITLSEFHTQQIPNFIRDSRQADHRSIQHPIISLRAQ